MSKERKLVFNKDAFPRYAYASKHAEQLDKKATCLRSSFETLTCSSLVFGEVSVFIQSCHLDTLSVEELQYIKSKVGKEVSSSVLAMNGHGITETKQKGGINPKITITTSDDVPNASFKELTSDIFIVVEGNPIEADKAFRHVRGELDQNIIAKICSREQTAMAICTTLELFVLRVLKSRIAPLKLLYDKQFQTRQTQTNTKSQMNGEGGIKVDSIGRFKRPIEDVCTPSATRSGKKFRETECTDSESLSISDRQRIAMIKDTLHEAHALYRRSGISQDESPFLNDDVPVLSDKLAKSLYNIDDRIYGCGFRNLTLEVFVNVSQNVITDKEYENLRLNIAAVAREFGDFETEIKVGRYEQLNYSTCQVGNKIKNVNGQVATLGGFAKKQGELHVLLARHFADPEHVKSIYYVDSQGRNGILASVLPGSHRGFYDISVAKVLRNISNTMFRNSEGQPMNSSLMDMSTVNRMDLCERHVHFWADEQQPRVGKIVIPDFDKRSSDTRYVLIKEVLEVSEEHNELRPRRLCEMGHSGAIFCSDDIDGQCVHVCTMLIGSINYRDVANDPKIQGEYTSFSLKQGITQLNEEHGGPFDIC